MKTANRTVTALRLVQDALAKAKALEDYHVFTFLNEENALKKARALDARIKKGEKVGRLAGVPYALKDNFMSPEGPTTASSKILEPLISPITATAVAKLEAEGAIMIGRTNLDAFAHGSSTENSYFGPTKNAVDPTRVPGGSSGGSAAAVALGIVEFATGTDTGGSIRQPASFNGVYGFKPTFGTISRYGVVAMASSTDCVGFFANTPEDIDLLMTITAGRDPRDHTTLPDFYGVSPENTADVVPDQFADVTSAQPAGAVLAQSDAVTSQLGAATTAQSADIQSAGTDTSQPAGNVSSQPAEDSSSQPANSPAIPFASLALDKSKKCGIIKDFDNDAVDPEIRRALQKQCKLLRQNGVEIIELEMPMLKYALAVYYIIVPAEVASNLSRHDGIRYGYRAEDARELGEVYRLTRTAGFMPENRRRIMIGNFVLSSGFYDAYFLKAQKVRTLIIREYARAFEQCDFLLTPVAPNPPFKFGEKTADPVAMYLEDVMSVPVNLAGLPGLTIPVGTTKTGLPIGLQLVGPRRSDRELLAFAGAIATMRKDAK